MRKGDETVYQGNFAPKHRNQHRKPLLLIASLVLIVALAAGGTVAWIRTQTDPVVNKLLPSSVPIHIQESFDGTTKKDVAIQNYGNTEAYIRVAVVSNAVDENGNVTIGTAPTYEVNTTYWQELDGYYYYKNTVPPGGTTKNLFNGDVSVAGGEINILAESIQAVGSYGGQAPETYAWGVSYSGGIWSEAGGA